MSHKVGEAGRIIWVTHAIMVASTSAQLTSGLQANIPRTFQPSQKSARHEGVFMKALGKAILGLVMLGGTAPLLASGAAPTVHAEVQQIAQVPKLQEAAKPEISKVPNSEVAAPEKTESPKVTEFVDVARLVLEHNRDVATSTSAHFDRTINILVAAATAFAAVFAAIGWIGWNKVKSLQDAAKDRLDLFNDEIDKLHTNASEVRDDFSKSLDCAMDELRAEINCRIELLTARAEIANAESTSDPTQRSQGFASAISRIERALQLDNLSSIIKIKALADLGYAKKRNGDVEGAFRKVIEAEGIAVREAVHMVALLAYNAACYSAILKRADTRFWLEKAIAADEGNRDSASSDDDLISVRHEPWFQALMVRP